MILQAHPTWEILDSSKIQTFMDCPRRYFYEYVLAWRPDAPNNHLIFGDAWHKALEILMLGNYSDESLVQAMQEFETTYRARLPEGTDEIFAPKTPANAFKALVEYCSHYPGDKQEHILHTEIGGRVAIGPNRFITFRCDAILEKNGIVFAREHKTTGRSFSQLWSDQWELSFQVGTYSFALHCLFPEVQSCAVEVNGTAFLKTKISFLRVPVYKGPSNLNTWLFTANHYFDRIQDEHHFLETSSEDDSVLTAFPMNPQSCTKYLGCPYHDLCVNWANPLQHLNFIPEGFAIEYWNPLDRDIKNLVTLTPKEI